MVVAYRQSQPQIQYLRKLKYHTEPIKTRMCNTEMYGLKYVHVHLSDWLEHYFGFQWLVALFGRLFKCTELGA